MTEFQTRRPSGQAAYPIALLAGVEGGGKSWTAAAATGLPYFKRSFWLEVGEQMADEYGDVPGADYEIIDHDGSYRQILAACRWAAAESKKSGPGVFVFDSMSELWSMLSDEAQLEANARAARKGRTKRDGGEADIAPDLWNKAKDRSNDVMDALREFNGLVLLTCRLEHQNVIGDGGAPTGEKVWKMRTHKDVPFYAQVIMQAREPRRWTMTKVASTKLSMPSDGILPWPEFTIEELLIRMELDGDRSTAARRFVRADPGAAAEEQGEARPQDDSPSADEPRGDLPALPSRADLEAEIAACEETLNKPRLLDLYNLGKAHNHRITMALTESAGKRVARRLSAGEVPTYDGAQAEADAAAQAAEGTQADPEEAPSDVDPQVTDGSNESSNDSSAEPSETSPETTPEAPERNEDAPADPPVTEGQDGPSEADWEAAIAADVAAAEAARDGAPAPAAEPVDDGDRKPMPEYAPDGKVWNAATGEWVDAPQPDPEESRRNTPRRRGVRTALLNHYGNGDAVADAVFGHYGLENPDDVSTARLQELLKYAQGGTPAAE